MTRNKIRSLLDVQIDIPDDENAKILRYLDFWKFKSILHNRALHFVRGDKLSDKFEGSVTNENIRRRPEVYKNIPEGYKLGLSDFIKLRRIFIYVNCWTLSDHEIDAMWKLYVKSNEGLAIQSSYKRLYDNLKNALKNKVCIGKIKYIDWDKYTLDELNVYSAFFHKRKGFEHEKELRAVILLYSHILIKIIPKKNQTKFGILIPVDLDVIIEKIIISPTSSEGFIDSVKNEMKKHNLSKKIVLSELDGIPKY